MAIVLRILAMILAYVLACVAAALVLAAGTLVPQWDDLAANGAQSAALWTMTAVAAPIIGAAALLPALLVIALAEGFAWRAIVFYGVIGAAMALALRCGLDFLGYIGERGADLAHRREVFAAAGIAGGLVYWLFAGRKAGVWK